MNFYVFKRFSFLFLSIFLRFEIFIFRLGAYNYLIADD